MDTDITYTPDYFAKFGEFVKFNKIDDSLFNGMVQKLNAEKYLYDTFTLVLSGNSYNVSQLLITNTIAYILSKDVNILHNIIISVINKNTLTFNKTIQQLLIDNVYTNNDFFNKYNTFIKNAFILKQILKPFNTYFITNNNKHLITIYINYLFYTNVIDTLYYVSSNKLYMYEILLNCTDMTNITDFFSVYKLYNYYLGFSYSLQNITDRTLYFNTDLDTLFINTCKTSSPEFIKLMMTYIDTNIRDINKLLHIKNIDTVQQTIKNISDYLKMGIKLCNKTDFMVHYMNYLQSRLLDINYICNINIETEFVKAFMFKDNTELYIKIFTCINDIKQSEFITNIINSACESNFTYNISHNYISTLLFNKNICKYMFLTYYAWKDSMIEHNLNNSSICINSINDSLFISYYTNILRNFLYNKDTSINQHEFYTSVYIDYISTTGVFELISDKLYTINANLLQIMIFDIINKYGIVTAKDLSEKLGIPLAHLSLCINSLIDIKLIIKENTANNNPLMILKLNNNWIFHNTHICLVTIYENIKQKIYEKQLQKTKSTENLTKLYDSIKEQELFTINKAKIISFMADTSIICKYDIIQYINTENLYITDTMLDNILTTLVSSNLLKVNNDIYFYNDINSDDDYISDTDIIYNTDFTDIEIKPIILNEQEPEIVIVHEQESEPEIVHEQELESEIEIVHKQESEIVHKQELESEPEIVHKQELEIVHKQELESEPEIVHKQELENEIVIVHKPELEIDNNNIKIINILKHKIIEYFELSEENITFEEIKNKFKIENELQLKEILNILIRLDIINEINANIYVYVNYD